MSSPAQVMLRREGVDRTGRPYLIRPTSGDDAEALVALRDAVVGEGRWVPGAPGERSPLEERLALASLISAGGLALCLEVDGKVAGQLSVVPLHGPQSHVGELSIAIAEEHRDRGLGKALLDVAVAWAGAVRLRRLVLAVLDGNDRAIAAYQRAGFVREGVQRGQVSISGEDRDLVLMGRLLR
jgi:RimJ/RimL family protein N-acetyltransferase